MLRFLRAWERPLDISPLAKLLLVYSITLKKRLRGDTTTKGFENLINQRQIEYIATSDNWCLAAINMVCDWNFANCKRASTGQPSILENYHRELIDCLGNLER
jgi:predicted membrane chloride channel (bestrophin family)